MSLLPYNTWQHAIVGSRELLLLPIGTGGVLYRPRFFHPIVFSSEYRRLAETNDDLTFRLASLVMKVPVVVGCWKKSASGDYISCSQMNIAMRRRLQEAKAIISQLKKQKLLELWRLNCNLSRNDVMLPASAAYLQSLGLLDLKALIKERLQVERPECFYKVKSSGRGVEAATSLVERRKRCNLELRACNRGNTVKLL